MIGEDNASLNGWLDIWCASDELGELWSVEYELMEEHYMYDVQSRRIDSGDEDLRVFTGPFKPKINEGEGDRTRGRMWTPGLQERARSREIEGI